MIPVERLVESKPSVLGRLTRGKTELEKVAKEFLDYMDETKQFREDHRLAVSAAEAAGVEPPKPDFSRFTFDYKRYREREVRQQLEGLFHGKCAYCEQRYGALHPMDVEHWRPKALVEHGGTAGTKETGYWWLASDWDNLLPSCIDCNRGRKHLIDLETGERVLMGKANQFPLVEGSASAIDEGHQFSGEQNDQAPLADRLKSLIDGAFQSLATEEPLLLNPCDPDFDPVEHFAYEDGIIIGRTDQAKASIRVYALNRPELVHERHATARIFDHRINVLADIAELVATTRATGTPLDERRTLVEQMHDRVSDELFSMAEADRPFAGMIRFMLKSVAEELQAR